MTAIVLRVAWWLAAGLAASTAMCQTPGADASTNRLAAFCHFSTQRYAYAEEQTITAVCQWVQSRLADGQASDRSAIDWIDRESIGDAVDELARSQANQSNVATGFQLGRIVAADLMLRGVCEMGVCERVDDRSRRFRLEWLDLRRGDILAAETIAIDQTADGGWFTASNVDRIVAAANALMPIAVANLNARRTRVHVAVLHFENREAVGRLDFFETDLLAKFSRRNDSAPDQLDRPSRPDLADSPRARVLQFPRAADAIGEAELIVDGLAQTNDSLSSPDRSPISPIADFFVWGQYHEVDADGVAFDDVMVSVETTIWDGRGPPKQLKFVSPVRDLESLSGRIVSEVIDGVVTDVITRRRGVDEPEYEFESSRSIADDLLQRVYELNRWTHRNPSPTQRERLQRKKVRLLATAALIDVNHVAVRREFILQAFPEPTPFWNEGFFEQWDRWNRWRRFAERFGNATEFDWSHVGHRVHPINRRSMALQIDSTMRLIDATDRSDQSRTLVTPSSISRWSATADSVPPETLQRWHQTLNESLAELIVAPLAKSSSGDDLGDNYRRRIARQYAGVDPSRVDRALRSAGRADLVDVLRRSVQKSGQPSRQAAEEKSAAASNSQRRRYRSSPRRDSPETIDPEPFVEPEMCEVPCKPIELDGDITIASMVHHHGRLLAIGETQRRHQLTKRLYEIAVGDGFDPKHSPVIRTVSGPDQSHLAMSPVGADLWVAEEGSGIAIWEEHESAPEMKFTNRDGLSPLIGAITFDGQRVFAAGGLAGYSILSRFKWETRQWSQIDLPAASSNHPDGLRFLSAADGYVATGASTRPVWVYDLAGGEWFNATKMILDEFPQFSFAQADRIDVCGLHLSDSVLWVASRKGLVGVDLENRCVKTAIKTKFVVTTMAVDGRSLWCGGSGSRIVRFDLASERFDARIKTSRKYAGDPSAIAIGRDRLWYATRNHREVVLEFDLADLVGSAAADD